MCHMATGAAADTAAARWREKDQGIWEVRGEPRHFLYSKLMCWVAADRGACPNELLRPGFHLRRVAPAGAFPHPREQRVPAGEGALEAGQVFTGRGPAGPRQPCQKAGAITPLLIRKHDPPPLDRRRSF